jgi:hypothetical protein
MDNSLVYSDNDLAANVPRFQMSHRFGNFEQPGGFVDDGRDLARFHELS